VIICDINEVKVDVYATAAQSFIKGMEAIQNAPKDDAFHTHASGAASIAESWHPTKVPGKRYLAYAKSGDRVFGLAGLMILSVEVSYVKVDYLCTHPFTSMAGVFLIKHAIKVSQDHGKGGTLRLYDASRSSFYDNLGFTSVGGGDKELTNGIIKEKNQ